MTPKLAYISMATVSLCLYGGKNFDVFLARQKWRLSAKNFDEFRPKEQKWTSCLYGADLSLCLYAAKASLYLYEANNFDVFLARQEWLLSAKN